MQTSAHVRRAGYANVSTCTESGLCKRQHMYGERAMQTSFKISRYQRYMDYFLIENLLKIPKTCFDGLIYQKNVCMLKLYLRVCIPL